jgi:hypothetical protein
MSLDVGAVGAAVLELVDEQIWCIAPEDHHGYLPAIEIRLVVRGWSSASQQVYLPSLPVPVEDRIIAGKKGIASTRGLQAWYERQLQVGKASNTEPTSSRSDSRRWSG